uniref:Peptidase S54 rhomboid domain-containing protein n=1 Tax=Lotharella oceanica TaxID=641309 RepID=A0A7S2TY11_9EUKA|mmetsp:Transcript_33259/g.61825  ORF Transcript_33259/g.61825 Transcript_33259/m.61825 type:complete len:286 (+) Transcript_33259:64-921(+)
MHRRRDGRRRGQIDPRMMMLLMQLGRQIANLEYKPPATLALMALNSAVYLYEFSLPFRVPDVCMHPAKILFGGDWKRLVLSAFYHADDYHLYYNMSSLLWKGVQLEQQFGTEEFIGMTLVLLGLSHSFYVAAAWIMYTLGISSSSMQTCAVGFSAVLFAYKVVLNFNSPRMTNVYGISVPLKYACWLELVMISIITPNASFLGHLCGILAGLVYVTGGRAIMLGSIFSAASSSAPASAPSRHTIQRGILRPNRQRRRQEEEDADLAEAMRRSRMDHALRNRGVYR